MRIMTPNRMTTQNTGPKNAKIYAFLKSAIQRTPYLNRRATRPNAARRLLLRCSLGTRQTVVVSCSPPKSSRRLLSFWRRPSASFALLLKYTPKISCLRMGALPFAFRHHGLSNAAGFQIGLDDFGNSTRFGNGLAVQGFFHQLRDGGERYLPL